MWILPISMVYFFIVTHAMPYCMHGWPICPNDTGACVFMTALATIIVFFLLFFLKHGCFLFPCLCVPDVPGWAFFPPNTAVWSPLRGVWDVNAGFFLHPFSRLWAWATTPFDDEKCMWEPQPENYKSQACPLPQRAPFAPSQPTTRLARRRPSCGACGASPARAPLGPASALSARRRNVATVATLGIGPDECLKPTYGGCSDPCARHAAPGAGRCSTAKLTPARLRRSRWERDDTLADEEVNGGSLGTLGGFDNQRQG